MYSASSLMTVSASTDGTNLYVKVSPVNVNTTIDYLRESVIA